MWQNCNSLGLLLAAHLMDGYYKILIMKSIVLWDLEDRRAVTEIKDKIASRGVRGMTYEYDYGGYLISYGFENYLNVWCPEVSLTRSFVGKLEGHSAIIVAAKFI